MGFLKEKTKEKNHKDDITELKQLVKMVADEVASNRELLIKLERMTASNEVRSLNNSKSFSDFDRFAKQSKTELNTIRNSIRALETRISGIEEKYSKKEDIEILKRHMKIKKWDIE